MIVTISDAPRVNAGSDQSVCASDDVSVNLSGEVTTASGIIWTSSGSGKFSPSNTSLNVTYIPGALDKTNGMALIRLTTTGNGTCLAVSDTTIIRIKPAPAVNAGPDRTILLNETAMLQPVVTGTDLKYLWTPNKFLNNNTIKNPLVTGVEDQLYTLTVIGTGGCVNEDQVLVKVLKPFLIPNTFTPNNDGINDKWLIPQLSTYPGCRVQVFNRYGQIVFESFGYATPWDGTMKGKSIPFGTYYYIIEPGNGRPPSTGYVTIIK
jgi:gliding motility-associated-like protein